MNRFWSGIVFAIKIIIIPLATLLLGVFAESLVQRTFPDPFKSENLPFTAALISIGLFSLSVIIFSVAVMLSSAERQSLADIERRLSSIGEAVGPLVRVLPYEDASKLLMDKIQAADSEVLVLSNYDRFDWDSGKTKELNENRSNGNPKRAKKYKKTQSKLKQMRERDDFVFTKIIQIPHIDRFEEALCHDPVYAEDCRFIMESGHFAPGRVSLRIAKIIFQNTFVIVDRSFLYLEFEVRDYKKDDRNGAPFVMIVEGTESKIVKNLLAVFERIKADSTLKKNVDVVPSANKDVAAR